MNRESETAIVLFVGMYLLSEYLADEAVPALARGAARTAASAASKAASAASKAAQQANAALQRGGARIYDAVHDDAGHKQDLPGKQMTKEAVLAIATQAGFPDPKLAAAIAFAESGGVPGAFARSSKEYSVGLWQINTMLHPYTVDNMRNPRANAAAAYQISQRGTNWTPWRGYVSGKYKQFLTGALA